MRKTYSLFILLLLVLFSSYSYGQRRMENLDRGTVAVKTAGGVYVNWRINGTEWFDVSYNIYRNGIKLNATPITGASNYQDVSGTLASKYVVKAVAGGVELNETKEVSVLEKPWVEFKLREIPKIAGVPDTCYYSYRINDMTVADLDGDGEYELIVKRVNKYFNWDNPFENKYNNLVEAYKMDGTYLWTIDLGPNVFHDIELNVLAYDFDGDGKAEIVMRSSEGTIDGKGNKIGDVANELGVMKPDGVTDYRADMKENGGYIFERYGIEFLSLYDGATGEELDRIVHIPREPFDQWGPGMKGGQLAHRATKFHYGAPYLDGKNPSIFISRGVYTRIKMRTYDVVDKKFVFKWDFDSEDGKHPGYSYQGYHNYVIADVDNDGCDEIVYGSMTVDHNGKGLYTTLLGHGDAIHISNFDPYRKGLEVWACLESSPNYGTTLRAAESGEILWHRVAGRDMGRCMAANITNNYKGAELWDNDHMYSASERKTISPPRGGTSFRIFWDGDLLEEIATQDVEKNYNGRKWEGRISKYDEKAGRWGFIMQADTFYTCNDSKGTPCLQADLFGDWREEIIYRSNDDQTIRIYTTTYPTDHRIYTLMHDMQYRQAIAWQMCGYNQPPHPSFFLGEKENMLLPPPPVMDNDRLVFRAGGTTWNTSDAAWNKSGTAIKYTDGADVLFDFLSMDGAAVTLASTASPGNVFINSSGLHTLHASSGKLSGKMRLIKQGSGSFSLNGTHDYTGATEIWDGLLDLDGTLNNSPVYVHLFGELSLQGAIGQNVEMRYGSRLYPGRKGQVGTATIHKNLTLTEQTDLIIDMGSQSAAHDKLIIKGDFKFTDGIKLFINKLEDVVAEGECTIVEVEGNILGTAGKIVLGEKYNDLSATVKIDGKKIILTVLNVHNAQEAAIHSQPLDMAVNAGEEVSLSVDAAVSDGGTLTYQWYNNTTNSTTGSTRIDGATSPAYTPKTETAGTTWFYVTVTNTNNGLNGQKTASVTSKIVSVSVLTEGLTEGVIINPSFEEGSYHNGDFIVPNGWEFNLTSSGTPDIQLKNSNAAHGTYRYYLWCEGNDNSIELYQNIVLSKGEYTLSASIKPGVQSSTSVFVNIGDETLSTVCTSGSWSGSWGTTAVAFVVPDNTTSVRIGVSAMAMLMLDNFQLMKVNNGTGLQKELMDEQSFAGLHPNPTNGLFTLNFVAEDTYRIVVTNLTGSVLSTETVYTRVKQMDISAYPAGIYFLTVDNGMLQKTIKVIKE